MIGKDDETKKIPVVSSNDEPTQPQPAVKGLDMSKVVFVPSDGSENAKPAADEPQAVTPADKTDNDITAPVETVDGNNPAAPDADVTAPVEVVKSETAKVYMPEKKSKPQTKTEPAKPQKNINAKKTHKWLYALIISVIALVLCAAVITTYVFPKIIEEGGAAILHNVTAVVGEPPKNINVLLVGTDKDGYRTDTIMVATYDNENEAVHVMQIPRDTYVKGNGRADKKINSAYFSGLDTLKSEIFKAFGIEIHRYLAVELDGFVEIIDEIGGVEVDVPINMHYDDPVQDLHIHINKGLQLLDGKAAEGFVRYRKGNDGSSYPLGDIDRMKAQKQFVQNAVAKLVSVDGISKIPELIGIVKDNIETDISTAEATSYAAKVLSLPGENINFHTAPGVPLYKYGGWYYFIDGQENHTLVMNHFNGEHNKKSYSPVYFDLTADPYESTAASATDVGEGSSDISDDERYTYYSPENDAGYYDDDETSSRVPVIDDEDADSGREASSNRNEDEAQSQQTSDSQGRKPISSQTDKPASTHTDKPSGSQSSLKPETSQTDKPASDDAPVVQTPPKPANELPSDAPQFDFD